MVFPFAGLLLSTGIFEVSRPIEWAAAQSVDVDADLSNPTRYQFVFKNDWSKQ